MSEQFSTTKDECARRRRRFRRDPDFRSERSSAGRLVLQARDLDMVAAIAKHRFLNTEQVCRIFGCGCAYVEKDGIRNGAPAKILVKQHRENCACSCGAEETGGDHAPDCLNLLKNDKHIASRLLELYQAGYIDRPVAQLQLRVDAGVLAKGSVPLVYCVTKEGLDLIGEERRAALGRSKLSWVSKINEGGREFIRHTLAVADVSIGVDLAMRANKDLERLGDDVLMAGMKADRKASVRPYGLKVHYKSTKLSAVCDLAFAIGHKIERKRWNFLVEVDMGHMPVTRAGLNKTSILRKLIAYAKAYEEGLHRSEFDWRGFRVLVLVPSEERVANCIKAAADHFGSGAAGRMFLFGTLSAAENILDYKFKDGRERELRLLE